MDGVTLGLPTQVSPLEYQPDAETIIPYPEPAFAMVLVLMPVLVAVSYRYWYA